MFGLGVIGKNCRAERCAKPISEARATDLQEHRVSTLGFLPPLEVIPQLEAAARRALALDDTLADAHALLACARMFRDYAWTEALHLCERALELSPSSLSSTGAYATFYLRAQGLAEQSLPPLERTLELDPLAVMPRWSKGDGLFACRRYAEAEREFREVGPNHPGPRFSLGPAIAMQRRFPEALAEAEAFVEKFGRSFPMALRTRAMVRALVGQQEAARADLAELVDLESRRYIPAMYIAGVYAALGERDEAFAWTNKSIQQREPHLAQVIHFHLFDLLSDDPRYAGVLKRMNLSLKGYGRLRRLRRNRGDCILRRSRAADSVFNHAAKAIEIEDIEARLSELERATELAKKMKKS